MILKRKQSLIRSDENWKIIDEFLSNIILREAKKTGNRWIKLHCIHGDIDYFATKNMVSSSNANLAINHQDIKRFCKQHHLKLLFKPNFGVPFFFHDIRTYSYLIRV